MNSKNISAAECEHLARVKGSSCAVCDEPPPSDAHHIVQGDHWTCVALCKSCHTDGKLGWHGERIMWKIRKLDELGALNITLGRLLAN